MKIRRGQRPADRFAQISNTLLQDKRLKLRARGLAALLLSYPPGWETSPQRLAGVMPDGRDAIYAAMTELEDAGYMVRWQERGEDGRLGEVVRYIFDDPRDAEALRDQIDVPAPVTENPEAVSTSTDASSSQVRPLTDFPFTAEPDTPSPTPIKTDSRKTDHTKTDNNIPDADASGPTLLPDHDDSPGCITCGKSRADGHHHRQEPDTSSSPSIPAADQKTAKPRRAAWLAVADARPDVMELLEYLHESVERCTGDRPKVSKNAFDTMRRLVDVDDRTPDQVRAAIDWARGSSFWSGVILGAGALRKNYAKMQGQAVRERNGYQANTPSSAVDRAYEREQHNTNMLRWAYEQEHGPGTAGYAPQRPGDPGYVQQDDGETPKALAEMSAADLWNM